MVEQTMSGMRARERLSAGFALATLAALTLLAWLYLAAEAGEAGMNHSGAGHAAHRGGGAFIAVAMVMWTVMMVAMMLPGASPMILTFARVVRRRNGSGRSAAPTWLFVAGYLAVWTGFSILGAAGQWTLHESGLLDSAMGRAGPPLGGVLLILAGAFQWTPAKEACLTKCRTPLSFLLTEWRDGRGGAFVMGLRHGAFCVGCCWALMLLMFAGGVMSLAWMGGLAIYMLAEKIVPGGRLLSRASGVALIAAGVAVAMGALALP